MAQTRSAKASLSHEERTVTEPREEGLHPVILDKITPVNSQINRYRFSIQDTWGINFLPGQWLDVHVPGIQKPGGFTITSAPRYAVPSSTNPDQKPFLELAIQKSPDNPPAAWLWQPVEKILGKDLSVRVGGSFVWPPPGIKLDSIKRVIFIAGGVGINPLMSMLSHICDEHPTLEVRLLYSTKLPSNEPDQSEILFLPQILDLFRTRRITSGQSLLELFFTGTWDGSPLSEDNELFRNLKAARSEKLWEPTLFPVIVHTNRIGEGQGALEGAIGRHRDRRSTVFYVCGPPAMTDSTVQRLREQDGVDPKRVLCEKWW